MTSAHRLRKVEKEELPLLTDVVKKLLPKSLTIYGILSVGFKCNSVDFENKTTIYIPENNNSPFFIIITGIFGIAKINSYSMYWKIGTICNSIIHEYLSSLEVNWTQPFVVSECATDILIELKNILRHESLCGNTLERYEIDIGKAYWIEDNNDIPVYTLSKEFKLEEIKPEYAEQVRDMLDYTFLESVDNIANVIKNLPSSAIFHQSEGINSSKEMVAWTLTKHNGAIGMTYTLPNFRGQKLATIVTCDLIRKNHKLGFLSYITIDNGNTVSINMHKGIGFKSDMSIPIGWDVYQNPNDKIYDAENEPKSQ